MKKIETSRIDELVKQKEALIYQRQTNEDRMHEKNSKLGTKIKKLENISYRNKVKCDDANAEIDREVKRINKLIELEREHANEVADFEQKPKTIKK